MQAMHGFREGEDIHIPRTGIKNIKEKFLVVQTNLCRPNAGEIDASFCFRPATTSGFTRGQKSFKTRINYHIARVERGLGLEQVSPNVWVGKKKPTFHWVSLAPLSLINGRHYNALGINHDAVLCLRENRAISRIEKETRCDIWIPKKSFAAEEPGEIGFRGTKEATDKAKVLVSEKIEESERAALVPPTDYP
jgi:hypothetical protein